MAQRLRAAVIGAGAIGAQLDEPGTSMPLTHAGGYQRSGFDLVAFVDVSEAVVPLAARWRCRAYHDVAEMLVQEKPDVISVCTPAAERGRVLAQVLSARPQAVVAEKPLTEDAARSEAIGQAYETAGVPLIVNYTRRFVPAFQALRGGTAMTATIRYAKGIRHNGTHALDLCRMLFGECTESIALSRKWDFWQEDPTVSAFLRFERCPEVFLEALDERCFTQFEVDITTPDSRLVVDRDGRRARWWKMEHNSGIPPGKRLIEQPAGETGADSAMRNLMEHVRQVVDGHASLCSYRDAVAAQKIAERLSS